MSSAYGWLRQLVYRDVQGRHHAYRGTSVSVIEDENGFQWLRLSDVRKILPQLSRDELLRQSLGADIQSVLPDRSLRIRAEALVASVRVFQVNGRGDGVPAPDAVSLRRQARARSARPRPA